MLCCSLMSVLPLHGLQSSRRLCPWDFPDKNLEWIVISCSKVGREYCPTFCPWGHPRDLICPTEQGGCEVSFPASSQHEPQDCLQGYICPSVLLPASGAGQVWLAHCLSRKMRGLGVSAILAMPSLGHPVLSWPSAPRAWMMTVLGHWTWGSCLLMQQFNINS